MIVDTKTNGIKNQFALNKCFFNLDKKRLTAVAYAAT